MVIEDIHSHDLNKKNKKSIQNIADNLADPIDRVAAFVVDIFIVLMPVLMLANAPFKKYFYSGVLLDENLTIAYSVFFSGFTSFLLITFYRTLMAWYFGGTLGKLFLGLRINDVWSFKPPKLSACLLRELTWWFGWLTLGFSYLSVYSNSKRRMYHDRVSDTLVINVSQKGVTYPSIYERSVVKGVFVGFALFLMTMASFIVVKMQRNLAVSSHITDLLEEKGQLCEAVGDEVKNISVDGNPFLRLELAMAMYAASSIGESCLESEVNFLFRQNYNHPLMYLAKAFLHDDRPKLSDSYLSRVCSLSPDSKDCQMSKIVDLWDRAEWERVNKLFQSVDKSWPLYIQVWSIRNAVKNGNFNFANQRIAELPSLSSIKNFKTIFKTKSYLGFADFTYYDQIADLALFSLKPAESKDLAAWICYQQVSMGCSFSNSQPCQLLTNSEAINSSRDLQFEIAQLRLGRCQGNLKLNSENNKDRGFSKLKYAIDNLESNNQKAAEILWSIYVGKDYKALVREDAGRYLIDLISDETEFQKFVIFWKTQPRLYDWTRTGQVLFNKLVDKELVGLATEVGNEIYSNFESLPEFKKSFIFTLVKSGERKKAWDLLNAGKLKADRMPASAVDQYESIYDELKREFLER